MANDTIEDRRKGERRSGQDRRMGLHNDIFAQAIANGEVKEMRQAARRAGTDRRKEQLENYRIFLN